MHNVSTASRHQVAVRARAKTAAELKTINGDCGEVMHESSPTLPTELKHSPSL